jgi:predicted ATPase/DNA-binding XRE family transcriptional regulator
VTVTTATDFASVLKRLRKELGLSQEALAERAAISPQAVTALECGLRKSPYPKTVALLADALVLDEPGRRELEAAAAGHRAARTAAMAEQGAGESVGRLPLPLTAIVGRERETRDIDALLTARRLVTIVGPGGIGKTTLAVEAARAAQHRYADGALFCDLSPLSDGALVASAIASARGAMLRDDRDAVSALGTVLKSAWMLVVLDNCEHLVADVATVVHQLLRACPNVTILATSRRRLGGPSEAVYRVPALETPAEESGDSLTAARAGNAAAVALFVQRASAVNPDFVLTDANAVEVARICRRLDGIALGIELAAAQVRLMSVAELEQRLGQRFRLLRDGPHDDRLRRRTLLAAFDWSYDLLNAREQRFFRALSIFAGTFPLEAALEICCDDDADELHALELLAALVDASLVVADVSGEATRYRLLETTRAYSADAMLREGEHAALAARHLAYYRAHAAELNFVLEVEDIRAALRWALDGGDAEAGANLLTTLGARWSLLGLASEGIARLEAFLPSIPPDDAATWALARITLSMLRGELLRYGPAFEEAQSAVALARRTGDDVLLFQALRAYTTFAALLGDFDAADVALAEAAEASARRPSPVRTILLLYTEGLVLRRHGMLEKSVQAFREAHRLTHTLGDPYLQVLVGGNVADAEHEAGNTTEAIAVVSAFSGNPALRDFRDGAVLANLVGYHLALGDDAAAFAAAHELFALRARPTMRVYMTVAVEHLALANARMGNDARAARLAGYCDAWYRDVGYKRQYTEQRTHERLMALLNERFSADDLGRLMTEGTTLSEERAVREALDDGETAWLEANRQSRR